VGAKEKKTREIYGMQVGGTKPLTFSALSSWSRSSYRSRFSRDPSSLYTEELLSLSSRFDDAASSGHSRELCLLPRSRPTSLSRLLSSLSTSR
jgi:hypothetical protein